jgi:L-gulonate 3-dehydrogenase
MQDIMTAASSNGCGNTSLPKVAIIGCGLIGSSWAALYLSGGFPVRLYDQNRAAARDAVPEIHRFLSEIFSIRGEVAPDRVDLEVTGSLDECAGGAVLVQESIVESLAIKRELFRRVRETAADAVLASSTSTFPPSDLFADVPNRENSLVVHPLLPPHLMPVSEIVPAPFTSARTLDRARSLLKSVGHQVIQLKRETPGFVMNRLQFALMGEAMHLVDQEFCTPEAIDTAVRYGLGLRWAAIGLFENAHLNAEGGVKGSFSGYGAAIRPVLEDLKPAHPWSEGLIGKIDKALRSRFRDEDIPAERARRNARLVALRQLSATFAGPDTADTTST